MASANSLPFTTIQQRVAQMIHGKILVGCENQKAFPFASYGISKSYSSYCIYLDLSVLGLAHPNRDIRDVALFVPFRFTLGSPRAIVRFPTMMWMLMGRRSACS